MNNMKLPPNFFWAIVSALLLLLSFPPFDCGFLAWFGLAPLLFALRQKGALAASGLAFLFGCLFSLGTFYWFLTFLEINSFKFILMIIAFSLYFLIFGYLYRQICRVIGPFIIIGAPSLWVAIEYVRSNLSFLSFPWNLIGYSQYRYLSIIQISDIAGIYGISFLIVMVNQLLSQGFDLIESQNQSIFFRSKLNFNNTFPIVLTVLILISTLVYGKVSRTLPESNKHLRVASIQANVVIRDNMSVAEQKDHLKAYQQLTNEVVDKKPALIVWPASSLPAPITSPLVYYTVSRLARETGAYLLVGGAAQEKLSTPKPGHSSYSNSEILFDSSGRIRQRYNKIKLVPFNEYIPLQGKFSWPKWVTSLKYSFISGSKYTLFKVSGVRFGAPICWESMFPEIFRRFVKQGAQFMVCVTNEAFYGRNQAPYVTMITNVFRAVENKVAIVRAATTGISVFINPDGEIVERIKDNSGKDLYVSGVLVRDVPIRNKKTFYTLHGDIFTYVVVSLTAIIILISLAVKKWPWLFYKP